jgi:hypothetical protein
MHVADGEAAGDRRFDSSAGAPWRSARDRAPVEAVILRLHLAPRHARGQRGRVEDRRQIDALGLPVHIGQRRRRSCPRGPPSRPRCGSPAWPCVWRTCSARKKKKLITCSGWPRETARSTGSCVAMPTGQVFRWHLRIMMQPMAISGMVAKPNSSAPSSAAMTTSRPVCSLPSVCTLMRLRRSFSSSTCCVSARPSSHGKRPRA